MALGVPGFRKAVISFWFRVPKTTFERLTQNANAFIGPGPRPRMLDVLPLLTFGKSFDGYNYDVRSSGIGNRTRTNVTFNGETGRYTVIAQLQESYDLGPHYFSKQDTIPLETSYIGIHCRHDDETGESTYWFRIRIQMEQFGDSTWVRWFTRNHVSNYAVLVSWIFPLEIQPAKDTAWSYAYPGGLCVTYGVYPDGTRKETYTPVDYSNVILQARGPDTFDVGREINITPDEWHHALVSFDLDNSTTAIGNNVFYEGGSCTQPPVAQNRTERNISNPSQFWIAIDDTNYDKQHLSWDFSSANADANLGDNGIASYNSMTAFYTSSAGSHQRNWNVTGSVVETTRPQPPAPRHEYSPHDIPSADHKLGIPCVPENVGHPYHHIEMAEFQMFTHVSLDTSIETNRRAFVAKDKDRNGNPVGNFKPVPPKQAQTLLKRRPVILLHGNGNWKTGKNTGFLGTTENGAVIPSGQFKPTGTIIRYTPEPELGKPNPPEEPSA